MRDVKTLKLAYRPVTQDALAKYIRLVQLEQSGTPSAQALAQAGLEPDDVTRVASAVIEFCRPRLLKRRLSRATPKNAERALKQQRTLAAPIDDSQLVE